MIEYRLDFQACREHIEARLAEPAPGRIQLLTGPRQVGKTTLLLELTQRSGYPASYAACDSPDATLPGFWERVWAEVHASAQQSGKAVLLLDEIQHVPTWAERLKGEWDRVRRRKIPLHVVASGSSALRLTTGSRETLAGRFERLTLSHWTASTLRRVFGLSADEAIETLVRLGSYPGAMDLRNDFSRWRAYVRDAIIEPAIGRDILGTTAIRRPALLRQVFALAVSMPGQIVSLQKLRGQLGDAGALETIAHYLSVLEDAFLVAAIEKYSARALRRRAAPPKLVGLNNALMAALDPQGPPDRASAPERYGSWVENACLAHAWNAGQRVSYWREEPLEVDAVVEGSWGSWAIEVKTGRFGPEDLRGLLEFCRRYPRFRPLVLTGGVRNAVEITGVRSMTWGDFLLGGLTEV
jgi:predicted AAA+ superfamily ATPase